MKDESKGQSWAPVSNLNLLHSSRSQKHPIKVNWNST